MMNLATTLKPRRVGRLAAIGIALLASSVASANAEAAPSAARPARLFVATYAAQSCKAADAGRAIGSTAPIRLVTANKRVPAAQLAQIRNLGRSQARRFPTLVRGFANPLLSRLLTRKQPTVRAQFAPPVLLVWAGYAAGAAAVGFITWCVYETVEYWMWRQEFEEACIEVMRDPNDPYARDRYDEAVKAGKDAGYGDGSDGGGGDGTEGDEDEPGGGSYDPVPPTSDSNSSYSSGNDFPDASYPGNVGF